MAQVCRAAYCSIQRKIGRKAGYFSAQLRIAGTFAPSYKTVGLEELTLSVCSVLHSQTGWVPE
jgi:hypothetical protein